MPVSEPTRLPVPPAGAVRRLRFVLACEGGVSLWPFAGLALHGALKTHLAADDEGRALVVPPAGGEAAFRDPPRPFALHLDAPAHQRFAPGEALAFEVRLFGDAAGEAGAAVVRAVQAVEQSGLGVTGEPPGRFRLTDVTAPEGDGLPDEAPGSLRLTFETPLRLTAGRVLVDAPAFTISILARAIMQRAALCAAGAAFRPDPAAAEAVCGGARVVSRALGWQDLHRHTREQRHPVGGLRGALTLEGNLSALWPWLRLGVLLHVGGKTTMGLGQIALTPLYVSHSGPL